MGTCGKHYVSETVGGFTKSVFGKLIFCLDMISNEYIDRCIDIWTDR